MDAFGEGKGREFPLQRTQNGVGLARPVPVLVPLRYKNTPTIPNQLIHQTLRSQPNRDLPANFGKQVTK
jgi:hypothetical protein